MHYSILFFKAFDWSITVHDRKNCYKLYLFKTEKMYILILKKYNRNTYILSKKKHFACTIL